MGDLDRRQPKHLVPEAPAGSFQIRELLRGQEHADPGLAPAGQQGENVICAQGGELVDGHRGRRRGRARPPARLQAVPAGADQILDGEGAQLSGQRPVTA
jgi:hypothetical protein